MTTGDHRTLKVGDRVRARFGGRTVDGVVTSVWGDRVHVRLEIDGTDEPVTGLYRENQLASA
jgi:primosomal protein N'